MRGPRKDDKGRELKRGESQIKNGSYVFRYFDEISGQRKVLPAGGFFRKMNLRIPMMNAIALEISR